MTRAAPAGGALALVLAACGGHAGPPDFARDVAPLLHENCAVCHHDGGVGPFPLLTYEQAKRRARQIAEVTADHVMPPWPPDEGARTFLDARGLDEDEIAVLQDWHAAGAPEGDPARTPDPPEFPEGWVFGEPDLVLTMEDGYLLPPEGADVFRHFVVPTGLDSDRWVRAFEFRPGNAPIVHHARIHLDPRRVGRERDAAEPGPGFVEMLAGDARDPDGHWLGWTPGKQPRMLPADMAWKLPAGADLLFEFHLVPSGKPEPLRASIGLWFTDRAPKRVPFVLRVGPRFIDLPAGADDASVEDEYLLPVDVEAVSVYAHAHLLGKRAEGWAELPGGETKKLLTIPEWDFSWQDEYDYRQPIRLPAGTRLKMRYAFDNSSGNPENPHDPPRRVLYGMYTSSEMADFWLQVVPKNAEDRALLGRDFARVEAEKELAGGRRMLAIRPDDLDTLRVMASACRDLGRSAEELELLRRIVALVPQDRSMRHLLAAMLMDLGAVEEAVGHYAALAAFAPDSASVRNDYGIALARAGRAAEALAEFREAVRLDPGMWNARLNLGHALLDGGDQDGAEREYRAAMELQPSDGRAREMLRQMGRL